MPQNCAECNMSIGDGTPHDVYQHTLACFHIDDHGIEWARTFAKQHLNQEYGKRILKNLGVKS